MKLVFHQQVAEKDWLVDLLSPVTSQCIFNQDFNLVEGPAIHVVSSNVRPLRSMEPFFRELRKVSDDITVVHLSDEWLSGGYAAYRYCDRVVRIIHSSIVDAPGILTIPLGYPNGMVGPESPKPAVERRYLWSFAGEVKASRIEMVEGLRSIEQARIVDTFKEKKLDKQSYHDLMIDTVFVPCPMGNVIAETWRLYEALEFGCIPIVEKRVCIDYYGNLLKDDPFLRVNNWGEARELILKIKESPDFLLDRQLSAFNWWKDRKVALKEELSGFVQGRSYRDELGDFSDRMLNRNPSLYEMRRMLELLRHQTIRSTVRRFKDVGKIARRVRRDSFSR